LGISNGGKSDHACRNGCKGSSGEKHWNEIEFLS
jgi:hypothetical protein